MRTVGIDLAIRAEHRAIVADARGRFVTPLLKFRTDVAALEAVLAQARGGTRQGGLQVVMEATGMAWFPIAAYLTRQRIPVYVVNSQPVAALRRDYQRHAKSDRIDARVLARLPLVNAEKLHRLVLPSAATLACQRGCPQLDRRATQQTAVKNRLRPVDRFAWPGLEQAVFPDPFTPAARWFRQHWYDPQQVMQAGADVIQRQWHESGLNPDGSGEWGLALVQLAIQVVALDGREGTYLDFQQLQAEVGRQQALLEWLEAQHHTVPLKSVRPLYRQIHPSRHLETIRGVGQDGAAV